MNEIWDKRLENRDLDNIVKNFHETTAFFNMVPSKTIDKKGGKSVIIKTQNQEKFMLSVILCITTDGGKYHLI